MVDFLFFIGVSSLPRMKMGETPSVALGKTKTRSSFVLLGIIKRRKKLTAENQGYGCRSVRFANEQNVGRGRIWRNVEENSQNSTLMP